jgi:hypothetical protein
MGGPSTVDKRMFFHWGVLKNLLIRPVVKMGAMMGGSKQELAPCYDSQRC